MIEYEVTIFVWDGARTKKEQVYVEFPLDMCDKERNNKVEKGLKDMLKGIGYTDKDLGEVFEIDFEVKIVN